MAQGENTYHEVASPDRPRQLNLACSCGCGCPCGSAAAGSGEEDDGVGPGSSGEEWSETDDEAGFADMGSELASSGIIVTRCGRIHMDRFNEFAHVVEYEGDDPDDFPGSPSSMLNEEATGGYQSMSNSSMPSFRPYSPSMLLGLTPRNEALPGFFSQPPLRLTPERPAMVFEYPAGARWMEHDQPGYPETIESDELAPGE